MTGVENLISAFGSILNIQTIGLLLASTALGAIIGALPGLTATMGIALLSGLTFGLPINYALAVLLGIYVGGIYGGSMSAILLNIPGTASAAATAIDGHQLALQGKAETAIKTTRLASVIGTFIGVCALAFVAPQLTKVSLQFQSADLFMLALFGVMICGSIGVDDMVVKGWIGGLVGLLVAMIRIDDVEGVARFTFNNVNLLSGISVIPAMIGFYAVPEVIKAFAEPSDETVIDVKDTGEKAVGVVKLVFSKLRVVVSCALMGIGIGALPGVGEDVAAWVSYDVTKKTSKEKEKFGHGSYEGIIAPEVGNNAAIGGALIPMLCLAVPGSAPAAVLLGALNLNGIRPGPMISIESPGFIEQMAALLFFSVLALWIVGMVIAKPMVKILKIPKLYLMPVVMVLSVIGAYAINLSRFDLVMVFIFGVAGYFLTKMKYSPAPIVLGIILGQMVDFRFRNALRVVNGDLATFVTRPISLVFFILILCMVALQVYAGYKRIKGGKK